MASKDKQPNGAIIPQVERPLPSNGKGTDIVKRDDPFSLMDALDDKAILAELEGRVVGTWVYHFPQEGQDVWGLSKVGVDAACREMAKGGEVIRENSVDFVIDPSNDSYFLFTAKASRFVISKDGTEIELDSAMGTKRQANHHPKGGFNKFWFEQGSMKALRNARQRLLSEEIRAKIMTLAKEKGKVKEVIPEQKKDKPPVAPPPSKPGNGRTEKAKAVLDRLALLKVEPKHHTAMVKKIGSFFGFDTKKQLKVNELEAIHSFLYQVKMGADKEMDIFNSLLNEVKAGK